MMCTFRSCQRLRLRLYYPGGLSVVLRGISLTTVFIGRSAWYLLYQHIVVIIHTPNIVQ